MKKRILVTGGLGFIGTNLIRRLLKTTDYYFIILDKFTYAGRVDNLPQDKSSQKRIEVLKGDICKKRDVHKAVSKADVVIHLAADTNAFRSLSKASPFVSTNVLGTTMLLEAIEKSPVERFIFFSSSEVYGNQVKGMPMDEDHPLSPITPYAVSKLSAEQFAQSFHLTKNVPTIIFRAFNAYGPFQYPEKVIPVFITRLFRNLPINISNGGRPKRDFVYVEDHVRAIETVLQMPIDQVKGHIFNLGTGKSSRIVDVAKIIVELMGKPKSLLQVDTFSRTETMGNKGVARKAHKILRWKPDYAIEDGLQKTIEWYKKNRRWWGHIKS